MIKQISDVAAFLDHLPDLAFIASSSLRIVGMNSAGMQKMGYDAEDLAGRGLGDFLPEDCVAKMKAELEKGMGGEAIVCRVSLATRASGPLHMEFSAKPIQVGTDRFILVVGRDVSGVAKLETELGRTLEAFEALQKAHATLTKTVVHDVVNPLTGILGNLDLLSRLGINSADGKFYRYLTTSLVSGQELQRLILSYHDLTALETGAFKLQKVSCHLAEIVQKAIQSFEWTAEQDEISVTAKVADGLPDVLADRELLQRAFENLLSAILRHTKEKGRVKITVALADDAAQVRAELLGTGNGLMDPKKAEALADFLSRANGSPRYRPGVSLAVTHAKYALQAHGGQLSVENRPGESLAYLFDIPVDGGLWG